MGNEIDYQEVLEENRNLWTENSNLEKRVSNLQKLITQIQDCLEEENPNSALKLILDSGEGLPI